MEGHWPEMVSNLSQAKIVWSRMLRILSREGATPRVSGFFFKAVIQAVLLFGAETWVVTPCMGTSLGVFKTQVERRLMGQIPRRIMDGMWKYTSAAVAREAAGLLNMEE